MKEPPCFLVGPTASGKSAAAIAAARRLGAEILSMDSMQVYRGMDIGTAKVPLRDRGGVVHHLLDLVEPSESFSVADYRRKAREVLDELGGRGRRALFVGGTHLYLKVMTRGLFEGAARDPEVRRELGARADREGTGALHAELLRVDPIAAARIHPNDRKRVLRALEVFRLTGSPISAFQTEWSSSPDPDAARIVGLRLSREVLHRRIVERVRAMLAAGWVEEVRRIRDGGGLGPQSSKALGYSDILEHLAGRLAADALEKRIADKTRTFARRQMTWLRSFREIRWIDLEGNEPAEAIESQAAERLLETRPTGRREDYR